MNNDTNKKMALIESSPSSVTAETGSYEFGELPTTMAHAMELAKILAKSSLVPTAYRDQSADVLVAMQLGAEIGLKPLQALQSIAVINGRPCIWGDGLIALILAHPLCEYINEEFDEDTMTAFCTVKRANHAPHTKQFSKEDAKVAGLWGRAVWKSYPKRMLQHRARGFALRDKFADALKGIQVREEMEDLVLTSRHAEIKLPTGNYDTKADRIAAEIGSIPTETVPDDVIDAPQQAIAAEPITQAVEKDVATTVVSDDDFKIDHPADFQDKLNWLRSKESVDMVQKARLISWLQKNDLALEDREIVEMEMRRLGVLL